MYKICKTCGIKKELSCFHNHKATKDGKTSSCKDCAKQRAVTWNKANPERKRASSNKWAKENSERRNEISRNYFKNNKNAHVSIVREYRKNNPIKRSAHNKVAIAVKNGELIKPMSCECCGVFTDTLHAHHCDYSKPLDVNWLCVQCHNDWHKNNTAING